jgi:predicted transposase YbfD/YdcC
MERVFNLMKPSELESRFVLWTTAVTELMRGDSINIDGKKLCGSIGETAAIHMVSAWANRQKLVLGQLKTAEKSNEMKAVPELLDMLDVEGCVITSDSLNCQKEITEKIKDKVADYVLSLKGNHKKLHGAVSEHFLYNPKSGECPKKYIEEKGHGRIEKREYYLETEIDFLDGVPERDKWVNLKAVGMVKKTVEKKGKKASFEIRYFITSLTDIERFSKAVREHWGIENSLHWCLDVAFNEDKQRMRTDNSAENFAVIRHVSLNLLKADNSKMSLKAKRHRCAYDDDFLCRILFG